MKKIKLLFIGILAMPFLSMTIEKYSSCELCIQKKLPSRNIPNDQSRTSADENPESKTYYYFFFSRPMANIDSSQNSTILHTEVGQITCTEEELSKMAKPIFTKIQEECKNNAGCTSDFNIYYSMDQAQEALKQWLKKFNRDGTLQVQILKS